MSDNTISEGKLNQLKSDQIQILDVYEGLSKDNHTILPFLKLLSRKLNNTINKIEQDIKKDK